MIQTVKQRTRFPLLLCFFVLIACNQDGSKNDSTSPSNNLPYTEKTACLLSQIAYCSSPQKALDQYLPGWKSVWEAREIEGNHAFVASKGNCYAIAIRGSLIEFSWSAFQNWIYQDLNVTSLERWPHTNDSSNAKIAAGSYAGFLNMNRLVDKTTGKTLIAYLKEVTKKDDPILLTGHSLGGNLATVYASWLWQEFKNNGEPRERIDVISFAAPAAGNAAFADDFDKKFPHSLRYENKNDIVAKFPCRSAVAGLGALFDTTLAASSISVGYKNVNTSLDKVFQLISTALLVLEFTNGDAAYKQTNGKGNVINIGLSGKNKTHDIVDWLNEAGYQHGIARYATQLGVAVVECSERP